MNQENINFICNKAHEIAEELYGTEHLSCKGNFEVKMQEIIKDLVFGDNHIPNERREISVYSNCEDERLSYLHKYYFHHWVRPAVALIETSNGRLLEVSYTNFKFL
jgi:hypothetical protein